MSHALSTIPGSLPHENLRLETVRHLSPTLQRRIDGLAAAAQAADGVAPFGEHKWLRLVRGDDRCAAVVLWRGDRLVGAGHSDSYHTTLANCPCRLSAELVVHPELRGRGFGKLLLGALTAQAVDEGANEVHLWAYGNLVASRKLAASQGLTRVRTLYQMHLPQELLPRAPEVPPGLRLRSFEADRDAYAWLALHNRVFADHPEQGRWDAGDLQARLGRAWFNARDLLLLDDPASNHLAGFCWVKLPAESAAPGEIYIVGVDPDQQGRGLGRFLTQAGLAHMRANGRPGAQLYVEADNTAALALYAQTGFHRRWTHVCWAKTLPTRT